MLDGVYDMEHVPMASYIKFTTKSGSIVYIDSSSLKHVEFSKTDDPSYKYVRYYGAGLLAVCKAEIETVQEVCMKFSRQQSLFDSASKFTCYAPVGSVQVEVVDYPFKL